MEQPRIKKRSFLTLVSMLIFVLVYVSCRGPFPLRSPHDAEQQSAWPDEQWSQVFARTLGWTGGDVAASFLIPGDRVLWVFGDTWVGEVEDNQRVRSVLVHNSIAWHAYRPECPGTPPHPGEIEFLFRTAASGGRATAWVAPVPGEDGGETWYWPTGGGFVMPQPKSGYTLALFLLELGQKPEDESVWGFQVIGGALAVIEDVEASPVSWKARVVALPGYLIHQDTASGLEKSITWGAAALYQPSTAGHPGYVYIYGVESHPSGDKDLLLARVREERWDDFREWEFLDARGKWNAALNQASAIAEGVASELSVEMIPDVLGRTHYVMVHSEPFLGARMLVRTAAAVEGPWSGPRSVYTPPEVERNKNYFAYAAKGHAALSRPGQLLISYVVNSHDFRDLVNDASIYRPRFVALPLTSIGIGEPAEAQRE